MLLPMLPREWGARAVVGCVVFLSVRDRLYVISLLVMDTEDICKGSMGGTLEGACILALVPTFTSICSAYDPQNGLPLGLGSPLMKQSCYELDLAVSSWRLLPPIVLTSIRFWGMHMGFTETSVFAGSYHR